jgi:carbamoyltransferase
VQPASDSSGTAVGAALLVWFKELNNKREVVSGQDLMNGTLLGPEYGADYIVGFLRKNRIKYREETEFDIPRICAGLISQGKVVGWFQGRVEFGARALGDRSILGDSRDLGMHKKLNLEVKRREPFRPFAPTVLLDKAGEYFELANESPYMLFTFQAKDEKREEIPAVVHVDGSSRVQTLRKEDNPLYYELLNEYYKKTGCPAIINTSFNTKGEPMVLSPEDAYRCFVSSKIDCLVMGRFLIEK